MIFSDFNNSIQRRALAMLRPFCDYNIDKDHTTISGFILKEDESITFIFISKTKTESLFFCFLDIISLSIA